MLLIAFACPCVATAGAHAEESEGRLVIPPGQEKTFAEMLGRGTDLPGGCKVASLSITEVSVDALYRCPESGDRDVPVSLHSVEYKDGNVLSQTERFKVVSVGPVPASLLETLVERVRTFEVRLKWKRRNTKRGDRKDHSRPHSDDAKSAPAQNKDSGPSVWSLSSRMAGVVLALLCLVLIVRLLPRRSDRKGDESPSSR